MIWDGRLPIFIAILGTVSITIFCTRFTQELLDLSVNF